MTIGHELQSEANCFAVDCAQTPLRDACSLYEGFSGSVLTRQIPSHKPGLLWYSCRAETNRQFHHIRSHCSHARRLVSNRSPKRSDTSRFESDSSDFVVFQPRYSCTRKAPSWVLRASAPGASRFLRKTANPLLTGSRVLCKQRDGRTSPRPGRGQLSACPHLPSHSIGVPSCSVSLPHQGVLLVCLCPIAPICN